MRFLFLVLDKADIYYAKYYGNDDDGSSQDMSLVMLESDTAGAKEHL